MIPIWFWAVLAGLLGLAVGSFLNVVIYRVPAGESIVSPPSKCPRCGNPIRNRHNIPVVGWLVLRGRCYDCGLPISRRYPVVEAVTGLGFAGVTVALVLPGLGPAVVPALALTAVLIVAVMIVVDGHQVPRSVLLSGAVAIVATSVLTVVSVLG